MRLSVVVPLLDERENVELLHRRLTAAIGGEVELEIIFVDDGSTDGSAEAIMALRERDPRVKLIRLSRNFGHQMALTAGLDHASGDAVVTLDADLQHPPELIPTMIALWREGHQIVYTLRESTADAGWLKRATSTLYYRLFRAVTGIALPPNAADFRLFDRQVVDALSSLRERERFLRGLTSWVGYRSVGVPYQAAARHAGRSKYELPRMLRFATSGIVSFTTTPLYIGIWAGLAIAGLGSCYMLFVLWAWCFTNLVVQGWTSVICMIAIVGGIQLVLLGIIGLYIGFIHEEVKQRPLYLVAERLGLEAARQ